MKKILLCIFAICLSHVMQAQDQIKINIILTEQTNPAVLSRDASWLPTKQERRTYVVETLKRQAETSQKELLGLLNELEQNGLVSDIQPLWIVNSIGCYATKDVIFSLEERRDIMAIYQSEESTWIFDTASAPEANNDGREIVQNLLQVNAPQVWEQGYTGQGVVVAVIDTGCRLDHADLEGRLWDGGPEYPNHGYDFYYNDNDPSDDLGHGTHVTGTICGNGASGTQTGIAPGATVMVLKAFNSEGVAEENHWIAAMQFAVEHGADLLNMSLGRPQANEAQKRMMRIACDNTLAAGVLAVACAGNIRQIQYLAPVPNNIYTPGSCPPPYLHEDQLINSGGTSCVICVGAVNFDDALAPFSSEGPVSWTDVPEYNDYPYTAGSATEIGLIRPDICAPGVQIKSLDYNTTNGYTLMDGTSMATPLVAGAVALMLSKNPELTPAQIDEILENTSIPLSEHKNNDFGAGRLDALAAVNAVDYTAIEENSSEIQVFPNPTDDHVNIVCEGMRQISVFSMDGKLVRQVESHGNECRIEGLPNGVYVLSIETSNSLITRKIVKL